MTSCWYQEVGATEPVDQGDLVLRCPVVSWRADARDLPSEATLLLPRDETARLLESKLLDVIVLTQTCDLAQSKAPRVVICRFYRIADYKKMFKDRFDDYKNMNELTGKRLEDKKKSLQTQWSRHCTGVKNGSNPNYCLIEAVENEHHGREQLIVDFAEIYSVPTKWLESTIIDRALPRVKLLPPYRDYVSHSFGRMYSRIGLEPDLTDGWQTFEQTNPAS